jgi:hypothetical protein
LRHLQKRGQSLGSFQSAQRLNRGDQQRFVLFLQQRQQLLAESRETGLPQPLNGQPGDFGLAVLEAEQEEGRPFHVAIFLEDGHERPAMSPRKGFKTFAQDFPGFTVTQTGQHDKGQRLFRRFTMLDEIDERTTGNFPTDLRN